MLTSVLIKGGKVRCNKKAKVKNTPNCLVTYCKVVRLMCFTNGHTVFLPQTKRYYNITHIGDSVKVALGIGNYALGRYCLVVTQAYHCSVFHMPKYPTANEQLLNQPSLN